MTDRRDGYVAGLAKHGFALRGDTMCFAWSRRWRVQRAICLRCWRGARSPLPTAMFASNDIIAVGASRALKQRGFALPDDVSIIGMDDLPICCVDQPAAVHAGRAIGANWAPAAVNRLIADDRAPRQRGALKIALDVQLVQRESVKELRAAEQAAISGGAQRCRMEHISACDAALYPFCEASAYSCTVRIFCISQNSTPTEKGLFVMIL